MPPYPSRIASLVLSAGLVAGCGSAALDPGPVPACTELSLEGPPATNLVFIMNDTMRRDRVGPYGGPAPTPALDAFARDALVFDQASAESSWTRPSIATLFTSLYPSQHGIGRALRTGIASDALVSEGAAAITQGKVEMDVLGLVYETLPEVMQSAGFRTGGFVANVWLEPSFGLSQGFEEYQVLARGRNVGGDAITANALEWLASIPGDDPFFLYLHYMDSHSPYGQLTEDEVAEASRAAKEDRRRLDPAASEVFFRMRLTNERRMIDEGVRPSVPLFEMAYHRGIENFDRTLGTFLDGLRSHPAAAQTAVIVTSDHGEAFFDRGYGEHGIGLHDDETALPFVAQLPGVTPETGRVDCPLGLIDVMPTLCTYFGLDCPADVEGTSLLPDGTERAPRYLVGEGLARYTSHRSIRNERFKLIYEPDGPAAPVGERVPRGHPHSLFDLVEDPGETKSLVTSTNVDARTHALLEVMVPALTNAVPPFDAPQKRFTPMSKETRDRLRALGYVD